MRALNLIFGLPMAFIYGWLFHLFASRAAGAWFGIGLFVLSVAAAFFFEWFRTSRTSLRTSHRRGGAPLAF